MRGWVLAVGLMACKHPEDAEPESGPIHTRCEAASVAALDDVRTLRGVVGTAPDRSAIIAPQVAGRLLRVTVREAQAVRRGDVLLEVESQPARDALAQARATLAQARAGLRNATTSLERSRTLFARGIVARQEIDDAETREAQMQAGTSAARAMVANAQLNVSRAVVRAPFDAVVIAVHKRVGELVDGTPNTPVVELADPSALELLASAPPSDLVALRVGQHATVRFEALAEVQMPARVLAVSPSLTAATGLGAVRFALEAGEVRPPLGLAGAATVAVGQRADAVFVPLAALRGGSGGSEVVICDEGHAHVQAVRTGARDARRAQIVEGLAAGQRVALEGLLALTDGAEIVEGGH